MLDNYLQLNWRAATILHATDPEWKRKVFVGGLVLLIPIVGWPALLGYRKAFVQQLVAGNEPVLPEWRGRFWAHTAEGFKAIFVIFAYLAPVILWFFICVADHPSNSELPWIAIACFLLLLPIFSPLAVPVLVNYFIWFATVPSLNWQTGMSILCTYSAVTFLIPAGFLQVSRTGKIRSAFNLWAMGRLLIKYPQRYLEAWLGSCCLSLIGHFAIPFSPWGVLWCYLGIVYVFNEVPFQDDEKEHHYLQQSWIAKVEAGEFETFQQESKRITTHYQGKTESPDRSSAFTTVRMGLFEIPVR